MTTQRPGLPPAPCVRGCTTLQHLPGCGCTDDGHEHVDPVHPHADGDLCSDDCRWCDECDGCEPAPAAVGRVVDGQLVGLCRGDAGRIERALLDVEPLVVWVRGQLARGATPEGPKVGGSKEPPAPLTLAAVDDVDELLALLWSWTADTAAAEHLQGPAVAGIRIRPQLRARTNEYLDEHGARRRDVVYRDAQVVGLRGGADAGTAAATVASWLATQLEAIAGRPGAADFHNEITAAVGHLRHAWPQADRATKLPLPCPECDLQMLHLHPPPGPPSRDEHGKLLWAHTNTVACHNDACGRTMALDDYYLAVQTAAAERTAAAGRLPRQKQPGLWVGPRRFTGTSGRP